jgi:uncharacterized protein
VSEAPIPANDQARPCPHCGKLFLPRQSGATAAFCSKRCANVDLNRWLSGTYVIPVASDEAEEAPEDQVRDD